MSRALNVTASQAEVKASADANNVRISAIETILSGGTRVVFMNSEGAAQMRTIFADRMLTGTIVRSKWVRNG